MPRIMDRSKVVVILEDDHAVRGLLSKVLQDQGYYVVAVDKGERALMVLQQVRAKLLIMDPMLPEMDGKDVIRQLRADERTRDVPVMVMSYHVDPLGEGSGGDRSRVLDKPFEIEKVLTEVERIVGKARESRLRLPVAGSTSLQRA